MLTSSGNNFRYCLKVVKNIEFQITKTLSFGKRSAAGHDNDWLLFFRGHSVNDFLEWLTLEKIENDFGFFFCFTEGGGTSAISGSYKNKQITQLNTIKVMKQHVDGWQLIK